MTTNTTPKPEWMIPGTAAYADNVRTADWLGHPPSHPSRAIGLSGLTAYQVVEQSAMCHPDWDRRLHLAYLEQEEGLVVRAELVDLWLELR